MTDTLTVDAALDRNPDMFTDTGNTAMRRAFRTFADAQTETDGRIPTADTVLAAAKAAMASVAKAHPEAHDTEPEFWAADVVNAVLARLGLATRDPWSIRFAL